MLTKVFVFVAALLALCSVSAAQPLDSLALVGSAHRAAGSIELTYALYRGYAGAAWTPTRVPVAGGFDVCFAFAISDTGGQADWTGANGGDGIAFVVQNCAGDAIGANGGQIGYGGICNALAVEFDTYANDEGGILDPDANHVAVMTGGRDLVYASREYCKAVTSDIPNLSDGYEHEVAVHYKPGRLVVRLDGATILTYAVRLDTLLALDSGRAWIGVTSGTRSAYEMHTLTGWQFGCAHTDTVHTVDTVTVHDTTTLRIRDTVTIIRTDTLRALRVDTLTLRDTITRERVVRAVDTLRVPFPVRSTDTLRIYDTATVRDTVYRDTCTGGMSWQDSSACGFAVRQFALAQDWPHILKVTATDIEYSTGDGGDYTLAVWDMLGRRVVADRGPCRTGARSMNIGGLASGSYVATLEAWGGVTARGFTVRR